MQLPATLHELMATGMTKADAEHILRQRTFGHDYKLDKRGNVIETGIGSAANPSSQHFDALSKREGGAVAARAREEANRRLGEQRF
jgi:hypothetical protein